MNLEEVVTRIERLLSQVAGLQGDCVARVCPVCTEPCCTRVHYVFSDKDLLFLRLSGRKQVWRGEAIQAKGCWFLGAGGCILEPEARPLLCHSYICPDLEREMIKQDADLMTALREKLTVIGEMRSLMWDITQSKDAST